MPSEIPSSGDVIYDFGANNGDDIAYYLRKPCRVVAVEANPALCRQIEERFAEAIASGRLVVLCCVITILDTYYYDRRDNLYIRS